MLWLQAQLPEEYQTRFWHEVHDLALQVRAPACTKNEALRLFLQIAERLLEGAQNGQCDVRDLHYGQVIFNELTFMYFPEGEIYNLYNGRFYELIRYMDSHDNIDHIAQKSEALLQELRDALDQELAHQC